MSSLCGGFDGVARYDVGRLVVVCCAGRLAQIQLGHGEVLGAEKARLESLQEKQYRVRDAVG